MKPHQLLCLTVVTFLSLAIGTRPVVGQSLETHWSEDGSRFWYLEKSSDGTRQLKIVRPSEGTCELAFDLERVAESLSKVSGKDIDPSELNITSIAFTEAEHEFVLNMPAASWLLDLESYSLKRRELGEETRSLLFLPPKPSQASDQRIDVAFINQLDQMIELWWIDSNGRSVSYGTIAKGEQRSQSTFTGHTWAIHDSRGNLLAGYSAAYGDVVNVSAQTLDGLERRTDRRNRPRTNGRDRVSGLSPDGTWQALVRDHQLWIRSKPINSDEQGSSQNEVVEPSEQEFLLASDASVDNSFSRDSNRSDPSSANGSAANVHWSPNSKFLLATQTARIEVRTVNFVESSPDGQLQPTLRTLDYPKPGDALPRQRLRLFNVSEQAEIPLADELYSDPYDLRFVGWSESGDRFWLRYNQRGHQVVRLLEVTVADGNVRSVAEETSSTFIHYSDAGKSFFQFVGDDELLWASERSGWNHLYRYDVRSGAVSNAITSGEWNVKSIVEVDEEKRQVWFYAVGIKPDQDPYHEHLCRVQFDGSDLQVLTSGDGTHRISFEQDRRYFIDTWSRVDLAPVHELRESETGKLICELQREDAEAIFSDRRLTARFHAPGRDGETEIWGIIHFPKDFDPSKKYPVVENIYAGPHDQHVPKSFRSDYRHQHRIADAGMIVVQIDGMGTAWRSKAFHDVSYKNLRDAGFPDRIAWIQAAANEFPQMDLTRVGIYGGSAGGQNAMAALLWHNDFYKVAVADCGCHDNRMDKMWWNEQWMGYPVDDSYRENSNMENAHLMQGELMLLVGELDSNVDPASTLQVVDKLIKANKDFEFVLVAGSGHGSAETAWGSRKRLGFLKKHLVDAPK